MDKETDMPSDEVPDRLYHYTTPTGIIGILTEKTLRATNILFLSDASEFEFARHLVTQNLRGRKSAGERHPLFEHLLRTYDPRYGLEDFGVYVFSLSEEPDDLNQWRAYCPAGGYSVGFLSHNLQVQVRDQEFALEKCVYDERVAADLIHDLVGKILDAYDKDEQEEQEKFGKHIKEFRDRFCTVAPRIKHPAFRGEKEWRLISGRVKGDHPQICYRAGGSSVMPYFEIRLEELPITFFCVGPTRRDMMRPSFSAVSSLATKHLGSHGIEMSRVPFRPL